MSATATTRSEDLLLSGNVLYRGAGRALSARQGASGDRRGPAKRSRTCGEKRTGKQE
jgi:hypothetical protein